MHLDGARNQLLRHYSKLEQGTDFSETVRLSDGRTIHRVGPIAGGGWAGACCARWKHNFPTRTSPSMTKDANAGICRQARCGI